jgi:hypothetical protein
LPAIINGQFERGRIILIEKGLFNHLKSWHGVAKKSGLATLMPDLGMASRLFSLVNNQFEDGRIISIEKKEIIQPS